MTKLKAFYKETEVQDSERWQKLSERVKDFEVKLVQD